ncbi:MAG: hypothetical protein NZ524_03060 [Thiobacillaceae bacterium]|nr:hypothetical protein [Thiobacillaceae bacterium]MCX7672978.1 hypothetical protein [Thiobacillaceae bacterium]MDW8324519.1 cytochrome c [Burkholderiales bacterium]
MRKTLLVGLLTATGTVSPALAADIEAGRQKAIACVACHGDQNFPGIFYTYQLAGRNADKLTIKTNKYRTGKILHPIMNFFTVGLSDKDVADISAYYQSLGKPAFVPPFIKIAGDDDEPATGAAAARAN